MYAYHCAHKDPTSARASCTVTSALHDGTAVILAPIIPERASHGAAIEQAADHRLPIEKALPKPSFVY